MSTDTELAHRLYASPADGKNPIAAAKAAEEAKTAAIAAAYATALKAHLAKFFKRNG